MSLPILDKLFAAMQGSKGIPALESTVTSLLGTLNEAGSSPRELASQISGDFALTQKVLKLANSTMYAPFASEAASVSSAVAILGNDALTHVVLSTSMASMAEVEDDTVLARTLLASELARSICPERAEDVSVAGLMIDLGQLLLSKFLPQEAAAIESKVAAGSAPEAAQREVLGTGLQHLGAEVARRWKMPASVVSIIDGTGEPALLNVARFSSTASSLIMEGKVEEIARLVAASELPGVDKSRLHALIERKMEEKGTVLPSADKGASALALENLYRELAKVRWTSVDELATAMFNGIGQTLKTAHCLLFMLTRGGDLGVRYGQGAGVEELKARLRVTAQYQSTAFHAVVKNNVDVSIADVAKLKATALPDGYSALLPKVNKFIILPIANSRVSGLIYCDWESDDLINAAELSAVKKLRNLFLPFFPR